MPPIRKKHVLQKLSSWVSVLSFISAFICVGILLFYMDDMTKVYKASFAASSFFFFSVAIVLQVIGSTDLPDFKDPHGRNSDQDDDKTN